MGLEAVPAAAILLRSKVWDCCYIRSWQVSSVQQRKPEPPLTRRRRIPSGLTLMIPQRLTSNITWRCHSVTFHICLVTMNYVLNQRWKSADNTDTFLWYFCYKRSLFLSLIWSARNLFQWLTYQHINISDCYKLGMTQQTEPDLPSPLRTVSTAWSPPLELVVACWQCSVWPSLAMAGPGCCQLVPEQPAPTLLLLLLPRTCSVRSSWLASLYWLWWSPPASGRGPASLAAPPSPARSSPPPWAWNESVQTNICNCLPGAPWSSHVTWSWGRSCLICPRSPGQGRRSSHPQWLL